jgi:hypothetical protein
MLDTRKGAFFCKKTFFNDEHGFPRVSTGIFGILIAKVKLKTFHFWKFFYLNLIPVNGFRWQTGWYKNK